MPQDRSPKGWKAKLNRIAPSSFIGRETQLQAFRSALVTPYQERQTGIFNISGQGGIGKTTLLKRFRKITEDLGRVATYVDEGSQANPIDNVPEALSRLATDLEHQGYEFKKFQERYKVFRQKKQELEADPDAPKGLAGGVGKFIAKAGIGVAKSIPGSGSVMEFVDAEGVANQAGEWSAFIAQKLTNKDEVRLVQEPLEVLTPIFVEELNYIAERHTVVLLLDTYEQTGAFLDDWLRSLLDDRYGVSLHENCLICIAGREPLSKNAWTLWEDVIARSELELFTEAEARQYLATKQVTHDAVIQEIWRLSSGGLPVLISMMAQNAPATIEDVKDPCEDAVERFLKWETDEKKRKVAQFAALPRVLNQDVLAVLTSEEEADGLFAWLKSRFFVVEHPEGWQYHPVVREQMLRYVRRVSPKKWTELHEKLAAHYGQLHQGLGLEESPQWKDETSQNYRLEWLYHDLCVIPQQKLSTALSGWLSGLKHSWKFSQAWAEVMAHVGDAMSCGEMKRWGEQLRDGLKACDEEYYEPLIGALTTLLRTNQFESHHRSIALYVRGDLYERSQDYENSLSDLSQAIGLEPDEPQYLAYRGVTYRLMERYEDALKDFDRAIELDETYGWAITNRGVTCGLMERYEDALKDFNRAIELDETDEWAIANRGVTYQLMQRYEDALRDFDQVIELDETYGWTIIANRGVTYQLMERYEDALKDFDQVIELNETDEWAIIANRGVTHRLMERYEKALSDLNHAIELSENNSWAIANRGETYRLMERYEDALKDFNRAIELDENDAWAIANRGETYRLMERYEDALKDFNRAIELDENDAWAISEHGEIHLLLHHYENALQDFNRALDLEPENDWSLYLRALTHLALDQPEFAEHGLTAAIILAQAKHKQTPTDWQNTLNLALYHLVAHQFDVAEILYDRAIADCTSPTAIRDAIHDLQDLLTLFPKHSQAQQMMLRLEAALQAKTS